MIPLFDSVRSRTFPWVNITIIVINFVVFFYELGLSQQAAGIGFSELDVFIFHWGNIPACTLDQFGHHVLQANSRVCAAQPHPAWTVITAMFMHGGWLHILGNMLFLWIFGDNVEDAMGHVRYAVFYLLVGMAAAFVHMFVNDTDLSPAVGASGAIAGVMAAYLILFPRATVAAVIPPLFFIPLPVPAFLLIGFWYVMQLFNGVSSVAPDAVGAGGGVAYFAHIGGFLAGALLVNVFAVHYRRPRRRPPSTP